MLEIGVNKLTGKEKHWLYVGTHRRAHRADAHDTAFGIYRFAHASQTPDDGTVKLGLTETPQPGWLALHPRGDRLYAVNEVREVDGRVGGAVSAFAVDPGTGALSLLTSLPVPAMPCHCAVGAEGRFLAAATFGGGSVHLFEIGDDGAIRECDRHVHSGSSAHPQRQTHPHAHAVVFSPDNRFLLVPDLGTDQLLVYKLDAAEGRLVPCPESSLQLPPLTGPRHGAFSPDGRHFYLINEMSATVFAYAWRAENGRLDKVQAVDLLPPGFDGLHSGAAIVLHPSGNVLYATTRSHGSSGMPAKPGLDLLIWFEVDPGSGLLRLGGRLPSGGGIPRSVALSPDGGHLYVAHQCSGSIAEFALSGGVPSPTGKMLKTPVPVCLAFVPAMPD